MKKLIVLAGLSLLVAGVAYLATLGCGRLMTGAGQAAPWSQRLGLSGEQKERVVALEKEFMGRSQAACGTLCAKRAQMTALLKRESPDRAPLMTLVDEIGAEQAAMEKATVDHVLAVAAALEPPKKEQFLKLVREELRTACKGTACGMGAACAAKE